MLRCKLVAESKIGRRASTARTVRPGAAKATVHLAGLAVLVCESAADRNAASKSKVKLRFPIAGFDVDNLTGLHEPLVHGIDVNDETALTESGNWTKRLRRLTTAVR